MIWIIYFLIILIFGLIFIGLFPTSPRPHIPLSPDEIKLLKRKKISFLLSALSPLLKGRGFGEKIANDLHTARVNMTVEEFFLIRVICMVGFSIATYFIFSKLDPLIFMVAAVLGFMLPQIWLKKRIIERKNKIAKILPETVDLLGLCIEAGLDFTGAINWLVEKNLYPNPLLEELTFVLEEIKWGKSRAQALKDMAKKLNIYEVSFFVQTLVQAERMGTSVSEAFTILSEDTRMLRYRQAERQALKAPIKILIPLVFCILPVIGIIIGGPILLRFMQENLFTLPR